MKYPGLAIGIALVLSGIIYALIYGIYALISSIDPQFAKGFSITAQFAQGLIALPFLGCHQIAEALERRDDRRSLATGRPTITHTLAGFAISWPILVVYGTLALIAITEVGGAIAGIIVSQLGALELLRRGMMLINVPIMLVGAYLVGRWIGTRSARRGIAVMLVSAAFASVLVTTLDYYFLPSEERTPALLLDRTILNFGILLLPGLVGYWRGQRQRFKLSRYMQYLLSVLPSDVCDELVDLAFQEAQRAELGAHSSRPPASQP